MRVWVTLLLVCAGCGAFEFHPYELRGTHRDLHARSLERLLGAEPKQAFRFAVVGDMQLFLDDSAAAMRDLEQRGVDFVVQMGDLTEFGSTQEYEWGVELLSRLKVPFFVVMGNHDALGMGQKLYRRTFGPESFSFTYSGTRFVFFDSNSREYGFPGDIPDLQWLKTALAPEPAVHNTFTFSHVPPGNGDFDDALVEPLVKLQQKEGVAISFHGHVHQYHDVQAHGVRYITTDSMKGRSYLWVDVDGTSVQVRRATF
ncbi:metallophosphoesterase family protein [Myxococcus vastator]|uniref:metallophosphoesterase family protein n=1 Tax=Myxococcus vastator TaxID=2709664 RepID=UPI0013CFD5A1|nr:metallophosphoesterase [Myxococcus vastator]